MRRIREEQNQTIEQVSRALSKKYGRGFSAAKIGRLETGRRGANPRDVRDLCEYYEVDSVERDRLVAMARDIQRDPSLQWVTDAYAEYIALESIAGAVRIYEPMFIPGLMQTSEYYRAIVATDLNAALRPEFTNDWLQTSIEIRRKRQSRLTGENPLTCSAFLDENVIRRRVGSGQVMSDQLAHLIELSHTANVEIRVIPASIGVYPGCESSGFNLLDFARGDHLMGNACYVEGLVSVLWAEQTAEREHIWDIFAHLEGIALDVNESRVALDAARRAML
jgi:transcriptional regulator with XRE-family HTH domain